MSFTLAATSRVVPAVAYLVGELWRNKVFLLVAYMVVVLDVQSTIHGSLLAIEGVTRNCKEALQISLYEKYASGTFTLFCNLVQLYAGYGYGLGPVHLPMLSLWR